MDKPIEYEFCRSRDYRVYVVCYADRFYQDVPHEVIRQGPWLGGRGPVSELCREIRKALERDGYYVTVSPTKRFNPRQTT